MAPISNININGFAVAFPAHQDAGHTAGLNVKFNNDPHWQLFKDKDFTDILVKAGGQPLLLEIYNDPGMTRTNLKCILAFTDAYELNADEVRALMAEVFRLPQAQKNPAHILNSAVIQAKIAGMNNVQIRAQEARKDVSFFVSNMLDGAGVQGHPSMKTNPHKKLFTTEIKNALNSGAPISQHNPILNLLAKQGLTVRDAFNHLNQLQAQLRNMPRVNDLGAIAEANFLKINQVIGLNAFRRPVVIAPPPPQAPPKGVAPPKAPPPPPKAPPQVPVAPPKGGQAPVAPPKGGQAPVAPPKGGPAPVAPPKGGPKVQPPPPENLAPPQAPPKGGPKVQPPPPEHLAPPQAPPKGGPAHVAPQAPPKGGPVHVSPPPQAHPKGGPVHVAPQAPPKGGPAHVAPQAPPKGGPAHVAPQAPPKGGPVHVSPPPQAPPKGGPAPVAPPKAGPVDVKPPQAPPKGGPVDVKPPQAPPKGGPAHVAPQAPPKGGPVHVSPPPQAPPVGTKPLVEVKPPAPVKPPVGVKPPAQETTPPKIEPGQKPSAGHRPQPTPPKKPSTEPGKAQVTQELEAFRVHTRLELANLMELHLEAKQRVEELELIVKKEKEKQAGQKPSLSPAKPNSVLREQMSALEREKKVVSDTFAQMQALLARFGIGTERYMAKLAALENKPYNRPNEPPSPEPPLRVKPHPVKISTPPPSPAATAPPSPVVTPPPSPRPSRAPAPTPPDLPSAPPTRLQLRREMEQLAAQIEAKRNQMHIGGESLRQSHAARLGAAEMAGKKKPAVRPSLLMNALNELKKSPQPAQKRGQPLITAAALNAALTKLNKAPQPVERHGKPLFTPQQLQAIQGKLKRVSQPVVGPKLDAFQQALKTKATQQQNYEARMIQKLEKITTLSTEIQTQLAELRDQKQGTILRSSDENQRYHLEQEIGRIETSIETLAAYELELLLYMAGETKESNMNDLNEFMMELVKYQAALSKQTIPTRLPALPDGLKSEETLAQEEKKRQEQLLLNPTKPSHHYEPTMAEEAAQNQVKFGAELLGALEAETLEERIKQNKVLEDITALQEIIFIEVSKSKQYPDAQSELSEDSKKFATFRGQNLKKLYTAEEMAALTTYLRELATFKSDSKQRVNWNAFPRLPEAFYPIERHVAIQNVENALDDLENILAEIGAVEETAEDIFADIDAMMATGDVDPAAQLETLIRASRTAMEDLDDLLGELGPIPGSTRPSTARPSNARPSSIRPSSARPSFSASADLDALMNELGATEADPALLLEVASDVGRRQSVQRASRLLAATSTLARLTLSNPRLSAAQRASVARISTAVGKVSLNSINALAAPEIDPQQALLDKISMLLGKIDLLQNRDELIDDYESELFDHARNAAVLDSNDVEDFMVLDDMQKEVLLIEDYINRALQLEASQGQPTRTRQEQFDALEQVVDGIVDPAIRQQVMAAYKEIADTFPMISNDDQEKALSSIKDYIREIGKIDPNAPPRIKTPAEQLQALEKEMNALPEGEEKNRVLELHMEVVRNINNPENTDHDKLLAQIEFVRDAIEECREATGPKPVQKTLEEEVKNILNALEIVRNRIEELKTKCLEYLEKPAFKNKAVVERATINDIIKQLEALNKEVVFTWTLNENRDDPVKRLDDFHVRYTNIQLALEEALEDLEDSVPDAQSSEDDMKIDKTFEEIDQVVKEQKQQEEEKLLQSLMGTPQPTPTSTPANSYRAGPAGPIEPVGTEFNLLQSLVRFNRQEAGEKADQDAIDKFMNDMGFVPTPSNLTQSITSSSQGKTSNSSKPRPSEVRYSPRELSSLLNSIGKSSGDAAPPVRPSVAETNKLLQSINRPSFANKPGVPSDTGALSDDDLLGALLDNIDTTSQKNTFEKELNDLHSQLADLPDSPKKRQLLDELGEISTFAPLTEQLELETQISKLTEAVNKLSKIDEYPEQLSLQLFVEMDSKLPPNLHKALLDAIEASAKPDTIVPSDLVRPLLDQYISDFQNILLVEAGNDELASELNTFCQKLTPDILGRENFTQGNVETQNRKFGQYMYKFVESLSVARLAQYEQWNNVPGEMGAILLQIKALENYTDLLDAIKGSRDTLEFVIDATDPTGFLTAIPPHISALKGLKSLKIGYSQQRGIATSRPEILIPEGITNLVNLKELMLPVEAFKYIQKDPKMRLWIDGLLANGCRIDILSDTDRPGLTLMR